MGKMNIKFPLNLRFFKFDLIYKYVGCIQDMTSSKIKAFKSSAIIDDWLMDDIAHYNP